MLDESIMWHVTARRYNLDIFSCDVQVGCAFVKNVQVTLQSKADWAAYINRSGQTAPKLVHFIRA